MYFLALLPLLALISASPIKRYSGVKIQSYRDHKSQTWDINPGSGSVVLHSDPKFALDAGTGRDNNEIVKLWTSYPTLFQQTWYLTGDNRIAITGGDQCLDEGDNGSQTWKCTTGNTNQIWFIIQGNNSPPPVSSTGSSTSVQPSQTSSAAQPSQSSNNNGNGNGNGNAGAVFKDPSNTSRRIHPNNQNTLCVTAGNGNLELTYPVNIGACCDNNNTISVAQLWNLAAGSKSDYVRSAFKPNRCLDVGSNPGSGSRVFVSDCSTPGNKVTKWNYMADKLRVDGRNLCLDVELNSGRTPGKPIDTEANLQVWECYPGNTQQIFTLYPL
ncbi:hypothetical protein I302_103152 [Kwoniella bestiolae CBS 10118]|uniref:Ricin B lectin domain-containing protein n=1 Tax=Kwoniella bestiolae CBS 10118 TaxID=1296100 RepID=A0A1B9G7L1_9TREE|nr:hypothetical protein I302_01850 [Kwoniella bestiolae CBS 10118]OCF27015.1 hypothetical protein I302_01850 [Kwoniella bestiolae CBS 10118]